MEILILANALDLKKKVVDKTLLEHMIIEFQKENNVSVFSKYTEVRNVIDKDILLEDIDLKAALEKFKKDKESFMLITKLAIANIDYTKFKIYHDNHKYKCSMMLRNLVKGRTTPVYKLDENKLIVDVNRKRYANCGIYIFDSTVDFSDLKTISAKINELMEKKELKGFIHAGYYERNSEPLKGFDYRKKNENLEPKVINIVNTSIKTNDSIRKIIKKKL